MIDVSMSDEKWSTEVFLVIVEGVLRSMIDRRCVGLVYAVRARAIVSVADVFESARLCASPERDD